MKRLYDRNQLQHFFVWLAIYLVTSIVVINLGVNLGLSMQTAAVIPLGVLSVILFFYLRRTGIGRQIGLVVASRVSLGRMWFYWTLLAIVCFSYSTRLRYESPYTEYNICTEMA